MRQATELSGATDRKQRRARTSPLGPMTWLLVVLLVTPIIESLLKGHFFGPSAPVLFVAVFSACIGTLAYLGRYSASSRTVRCALAVIVAASALGTTAIRVNLGTPEYVPSLFGYSVFLLALLVLDGPRGMGLSLGLLVLGVACAQVTLTDSGLSEYLSLAYLLCVLLLSVAWVRYVGKIVKNGNQFDSRSAALLERSRADVRELTMFRIRRALTLSGANDVLIKVLEADRIDDQLLADVRISEARLRDHLSAPIFNHSVFADVVAAARSRGVSVSLLGESLGAQKAGVIDGPLVAALIEVLQDADSGDSIVIRYVSGSSPAKFTVVIRQGAAMTRMEIDELGNRAVAEM